MQDIFSIFDFSILNIILAFIGVTITIFTMLTARIQIKIKQKEYFFLCFIFILSFLLVIFTKSWMIFIIAWEMVTVTTALMLLWKNRGLAGQYLIIQFLGSSLLICFILIAMNHGYTEIMSIKEVWLQNLFIFGLGMKSAVFGLHFWLPPVHSQAPAPVSAILSGWVVKLGFITYLKIIPNGNLLLIILGLLMIFYGGIKALLASDYKVLLAYSSISQLGFIALGIGSGTLLGRMGSILHILAHSLAKTSLFIGSGYLIKRYNSRRIYDFKEAEKRPLIINLSLILGFASLMGTPFLVGFNSKYLIKHSFFAKQAFSLNKLLPLWLKSLYKINNFKVISLALEQLFLLILYIASFITALYSVRFIYFALFKNFKVMCNQFRKSYINKNRERYNYNNDNNFPLSKTESLVLLLTMSLLLLTAFYSTPFLNRIENISIHYNYAKALLEFGIILFIAIIFLSRFNWYFNTEMRLPSLDRLFNKTNKTLHRTARYIYNVVYLDFQYQLFWIPIFILLLYVYLFI